MSSTTRTALGSSTRLAQWLTLVISLSSLAACISSPIPDIQATISNRTFWLLDFSDPDQLFIRPEVTRYLGETEHAIVYLLDATYNEFSDAEHSLILSNIRIRFEDRIFPTLTTLFGSMPSRFTPGRVVFIIGEIKEQPGSSQLGGYFRPADQYPTTETRDLDMGSSNEANILYLDPYVGTELLTSFDSAIYWTMAHEFYHLLNFRAKVEANRPSASEYLGADVSDDYREWQWLDEGMAEVATDIVFDDVRLTRIFRFSDVYNNTLLSNDFTELEDHKSIWIQRDPVLNGYSQSYMFARYVSDLWGVVTNSGSQACHYCAINSVSPVIGQLTNDLSSTLLSESNCLNLVQTYQLPGIDTFEDLYHNWLDALAQNYLGSVSGSYGQVPYPYLSFTAQSNMDAQFYLYRRAAGRQPTTMMPYAFIPWGALNAGGQSVLTQTSSSSSADGQGLYYTDLGDAQSATRFRDDTHPGHTFLGSGVGYLTSSGTLSSPGDQWDVALTTDGFGLPPRPLQEIPETFDKLEIPPTISQRGECGGALIYSERPIVELP